MVFDRDLLCDGLIVSTRGGLCKSIRLWISLVSIFSLLDFFLRLW